MQLFLDFLNNNSGLVAILGVVVGWLLSTLSDRKMYKRQKKDELEKEFRERFKEKAEFITNEVVDLRKCHAEDLYVVLSSYEANLDKYGEVVTKLPKDIASSDKLKCVILYLENVGNSGVNELDIAVANPKTTALIEKDHISRYSKKGYISYSVSLDRKLLVGDVLILHVYYLENDPVIDMISASLELYYRDSLGNVCTQPLFPEQNKIYEPRVIGYSEWREQVSVEKNLNHWKRRLSHKLSK